jgi:hypothetical protein
MRRNRSLFRIAVALLIGCHRGQAEVGSSAHWSIRSSVRYRRLNHFRRSLSERRSQLVQATAQGAPPNGVLNMFNKRLHSDEIIRHIGHLA